MDTTSKLRGLNLGGWFSQIDAIEEKDPDIFPGIDEYINNFISEDDIKYIKSCGFNHVRLPIDFQIFFNDDGIIIYPDRLEKLKEAVNWVIKEDLILMLDLHECPGHDFHEGTTQMQSFFVDERPQLATLKIWKQLAEIFGNEKNIFFEILNEPVCQDNKIWDELKNKLVKQIRTSAPNSTIIVGSNLWSMVSTFPDLTPIPEDDNIIYNCHFYNPLIFTHQFATWVQSKEIRIKREYPGNYKCETGIYDYVQESDFGLWDKDRLRETLKPVLEWRKKYNLPVICNEFGVFHQAPRKSQLNYLKDLIQVLEEVGIGWTYWTYKNLDFGIISKGESLHQNLPQFQNPERRDDELASFLANIK